MKFYVKWTGETVLFMLVEQGWNEAARKRVASYWWVEEARHATPFLSEEDAWRAFDKSSASAGDRKSYILEMH